MNLWMFCVYVLVYAYVCSKNTNNMNMHTHIVDSWYNKTNILDNTWSLRHTTFNLKKTSTTTTTTTTTASRKVSVFNGTTYSTTFPEIPSIQSFPRKVKTRRRSPLPVNVQRIFVPFVYGVKIWPQRAKKGIFVVDFFVFLCWHYLGGGGEFEYTK